MNKLPIRGCLLYTHLMIINIIFTQKNMSVQEARLSSEFRESMLEPDFCYYSDMNYECIRSNFDSF